MKRSDYDRAWKIITAWDETETRADELTALQTSPRRPYVVIAMLRIAAALASFVGGSDGFVKQLRQTSYSEMEEGTLHITDQIFAALQPNADIISSLDDIVGTFASQEAPAEQEAIQPATSQAIQMASTQTVKPAEQARTLPGTGKILRIDEAPVFARVRVTKLGSLDTDSRDDDLLGQTVITWTDMERSKDIFAEVEVRGVLQPENQVAWEIGELWWLSGDAEVEIIDPPRYAGQPEELIKHNKKKIRPGRRETIRQWRSSVANHWRAK